MRNADDRGVGDRGMLDEAVLDLDAVDVLAAADDHVLLAVGDEEEAVVVDVADVAGVQPAVAHGVRGRLGLVPVAGHDERAVHRHLAGLTGRHLVAVGVADLELERRHRLADRRRLVDRVLARDGGRDRRRLGEPVRVRRRRDVRERLAHLALQLVGRRRTAERDAHDRRRVVVVTVGVLAARATPSSAPSPTARPCAPGSARAPSSGSKRPSSITSFKPGEQPDDQRRVAARHVEQRRGEQRDRLPPALCGMRAAAEHRRRPRRRTSCSAGWRSCCGGC